MQENYRRFTVELHEYTNEEIAELFQNTQAEECLVELMSRNKGLIYTIATSYRISGYDTEDLMSVGYEALWRAAGSFDTSRGYTFTNWIKVHLKQSLNRLYTEANRLKRGGGAEPPISYEDLAEINREGGYEDDYSSLFIGEFLSTLSGSTLKVAMLLSEGATNGDVARALGIAPASVTYHTKRIRAAYIAYARGY